MHRVPSFLPGHYEHGFDASVCAPGSSYSLFLKGGNDSNFGMTLKLPSPAAAESDADGAPAALPEDAETEDPEAFDGAFRPNSVTFYVRTDNERADAGHFILGESNEVNKRVAQFQVRALPSHRPWPHAPSLPSHRSPHARSSLPPVCRPVHQGRPYGAAGHGRHHPRRDPV